MELLNQSEVEDIVAQPIEYSDVVIAENSAPDLDKLGSLFEDVLNIDNELLVMPIN